MNHILKIALALSIIFSNPAYSEGDSVDPRLGGFLASVIKDPKALKAEQEAYAKRKVTFEEFIAVVFTAKVKFDNTPDNSQALSQIGGYIEKTRPFISKDLLTYLESFNAKKENETFMRGMLIATIKGVIEEQNKNASK